VPHSHLVMQHLMKQLELKAARKETRDYRPQWLSDVILRWSAVFQPFSGVGRVGFICEPDDGGWNVRLYLGTTEVIGGRDDGEWKHPGFELDLSKLTDEYTQIDEFRWNVSAPGADGTHSYLTLRGVIAEDMVQLKIYSRPPRDAGPAFRRHLDGTVEPVERV
jgi:hypothetical protein